MGRVKPFAFVGNLEGVDEKTNTLLTPITRAELIENLHIDKTGTWNSHRQGYTNLGSQFESGAQVDGLGHYRDINGNDYVLMAINGKIKHINYVTGAQTAQISTGATAGNNTTFKTLADKVYSIEKGSNPYSWAGSGSMTATTMFPKTVDVDVYEKPYVGEVFANRMAYANFNGSTKYPSTVIISELEDPEGLDTSSTSDAMAFILGVEVGDGRAIKNLKRLYIPIQESDNLMVCKERGIWAITGNTPTTFESVLINEEVGCLNKNCAVKYGNDLIFMDENGIHSISAATQSGSIIYAGVESDMVIDTLTSLNYTARELAFAAHLPLRKELWFAFPTGTRDYCDSALVYKYALSKGNSLSDLISGQAQKNSDPTGWSIRSGLHLTAGMVFDRKLYTGSSDGYFQKWFDSSKYNTDGFTWRYRFPYYDFGALSNLKAVKELFIWLVNPSEFDLNVTYRWRNGTRGITKTITKTIPAGGGGVYGETSPPAMLWGTGLWSESQLTKVKIPIWGTGERFQLEISGQTSDAGIEFLGVTGLVEYLSASRSY